MILVLCLSIWIISKDIMIPLDMMWEICCLSPWQISSAGSADLGIPTYIIGDCKKAGVALDAFKDAYHAVLEINK